MGVEVGAVFIRARAVPVAQMVGDLPARAGADLLERGVDARLGSVALGGEAQVEGRLREVDAAFRIPDDLGRLECGVHNEQGLRVGVADVLGRADHDAARDELGVLAGIDHAGEPVERGIGIAPAHRFDERRDDVVVHVAVLVVGEAAARVGIDHVLARDLERAGSLRGACRRGHLARELERREGGAAVPARERHDLVRGVGAERVAAPEAHRIGERTVEQHADVVVREDRELDHARTRDERGVDLEEGVLGGGAHEHHDAVLHGMEQGILLRAVEAVDLVDEQDRALARGEQAVLGRLDGLAQVLDGARDGRHLDERRMGAVGDDARERGLARARRTVEDDRGERILLDGAAQPRALPHRGFLADEPVEGLGTHPHRERGVEVALVALDVGEQRIHGHDCRPDPPVGTAPSGTCLLGRGADDSRFSETLLEFLQLF